MQIQNWTATALGDLGRIAYSTFPMATALLVSVSQHKPFRRNRVMKESSREFIRNHASFPLIAIGTWDSTGFSKVSRVTVCLSSFALSSKNGRSSELMIQSYLVAPDIRMRAIADSRYSESPQTLRFTGRIVPIVVKPDAVGFCTRAINSLLYWSYRRRNALIY